MNESVFIPGWVVDIDSSKLSQYPIEFQRKYLKSLIDMYIKRGECQSDIPFGIDYFNDEYVVVCEKFPSQVIISSNIGSTIDKASAIKGKDWKESFVTTCIHQFLGKNGYSLPVDLRGLVGRPKSSISKRDLLLRSKQITFLDNDTEILCHPAEWFDFISTEVGILVLYNPKHEIVERRFGLASKYTIESLVTQDWQDLKRNPEMVIGRFSAIHSIIANTNKEYPISAIKLDEFEYSIYDRPKLHFRNGMITDLSTEMDQLYSDVVLENIDNISQPKNVSFLIDTTITSQNRTTVDEFIAYFSDMIDCDITQVEFNPDDDTLHINGEAVVTIINDFQKGSGFIYDKMKRKISIPSKVVLLDTILKNDGNYGELVALVWLGIRFRYTQALHHNLAESPEHSIIAMNIIPLLAGKYLVLAGAIVNDEKIESKFQLFEKDYDKISPNSHDIMSLYNSLSNDNSSIILYSDEVNLKSIMSNLASEFGIESVCSTPISSCMIQKRGDNLGIPLSGTSVKLGNKKYLLQTDGTPDFIEDGIPSPILVDTSNLLQSPEDSVLRTLFESTFINPISLSKPKFPVHLHLIQTLSSTMSREIFSKTITEGNIH